MTCRQLRADLHTFNDQILRFMWEPGAQTYDTTRSSGSTGPIEQHRTELARDPARRAHRDFNRHILDAYTAGIQVGMPHRTRRGELAGWRLDELTALLASDQPIQRRPLGDITRLLDLARVVQLQWMPAGERARVACSHCRRTDMGTRPRATLCSSCYEFRCTWKRLPNQVELRRFAEAGRWRVRA